MELNLISKEKNKIVIELDDVKETLVHPIIDRLLHDKDVLVASYKTGHPQLDKPRLTVKTGKLKPETVIKKATDTLVDEIKAFSKEFEKGAKRYLPTKEKEKKTTTTKPKKTEDKKAKTAKPKKTEDKKAKTGKKTKKK